MAIFIINGKIYFYKKTRFKAVSLAAQSLF